MGVIVTVIDDSDRVGIAASVTRIGELYMTSVANMVANVLGFLATYTPPPRSPADVLAYSLSHGRLSAPPMPAAGTTKMSKLNVLDHGNTSGLEIGTDWVSTGSFARFQSEFARLTPKFESGAYVHLAHCEAGMNIRLMEMFADTFGVPVVAGRGLTHAVFRANTGNYVRVYPARAGSRPASDTFFWGPSSQ